MTPSLTTTAPTAGLGQVRPCPRRPSISASCMKLRFDRPLAQGDLHRAHQLVAIERHPAAVALDHRELAQLHPLERGEAEIAGDTYPPPPDNRGILGRTGVLYLGIETVAAWAAHAATPSLIDWKTIGERPDPFLDRSFDHRRRAVFRLRDGAEHFGD